MKFNVQIIKAISIPNYEDENLIVLLAGYEYFTVSCESKKFQIQSKFLINKKKILQCNYKPSCLYQKLHTAIRNSGYELEANTPIRWKNKRVWFKYTVVFLPGFPLYIHFSWI